MTVNPLSPREEDVLRQIAEGYSTKELACRLGITFKTADTHRMNLMRKLGINKVTGLVRYAIRSGLIAA